jgi:hypothetical protein
MDNKFYIVVFWFKLSDTKNNEKSFVTISAKNTDDAREKFIDHYKVWEIPITDYTIYESKYVHSEIVTF